jgi:uncharacterized protein
MFRGWSQSARSSGSCAQPRRHTRSRRGREEPRRPTHARDARQFRSGDPDQHGLVLALAGVSAGERGGGAEGDIDTGGQVTLAAGGAAAASHPAPERRGCDHVGEVHDERDGEEDGAERGTILRATVASTVHGLHHSGQDDRDEMAVFIESPEYLLGLARARGIRGGQYGFEHYVERTKPEGVRSGPGDLDLVAYSLRKYVRLALKGHPTILLLLFVPDELVLVKTELGEELRDLRPALLSRRAGHGYLGYLRGQKERLLGTRAQTRVNRPELVEAHGFDTKYAMHAARLGHQGLELLETGRLTLPMPEPERSRVMAIRTGERTFEETIAEIDEVERRLAEALERTPLPPEPDRAAVDRFLVQAYRRAWRW